MNTGPSRDTMHLRLLDAWQLWLAGGGERPTTDGPAGIAFVYWAVLPGPWDAAPQTASMTAAALDDVTPVEQEAVRRVGPHVWWCYRQIFSFIWLLLLLTPMLVLYAVIWILMAAGVHMVNHPEASISVWRSRSPIT